MKYNFFTWTIILFFNLFLTNSCGIIERAETLSQGQTGNLIITPSPTKGNTQLLSNRINLKGGDFICRRGFPVEERYDLDLDELNDDPKTDLETETETETKTTETDNKRQDNVLTTVGDNWFKVGFNFQNKSEHHLIIDQITFYMEASYGTEPLIGTIEVNTSYCGSNSEFIPTSALYIIPPTGNEGYNYNENLKNGINNLTIFVSGVPLPTAPKQSINTLPSPETDTKEPFVSTSVPTYNVTARFFGRLVNSKIKEQNTVVKKIFFTVPGYSFIQ